jgi:hypothetical protein
VKDEVWSLLHLGSFELIRETQELGDPGENATKEDVWGKIIGIERTGGLGVIKLMIGIASLRHRAWQLNHEGLSTRSRAYPIWGTNYLEVDDTHVAEPIVASEDGRLWWLVVVSSGPLEGPLEDAGHADLQHASQTGLPKSLVAGVADFYGVVATSAESLVLEMAHPGLCEQAAIQQGE